MQTALLTGSLLYMSALIIALLAFAFMWIVIVVRIAISNRSAGQKAFWIIGILLFAPLALVCALRDESKFWRIYAIVTLVLFLPAIVLGLTSTSQEKAADKAANHTTSQQTMEGPTSLASSDPSQTTIPAVPVTSPQQTPLMAYMQQMVERMDNLAKNATDSNDKVYFSLAALKVTVWRTQLLNGKFTEQQIHPHLATLLELIKDSHLTAEEYTKWSEVIKTAGL